MYSVTASPQEVVIVVHQDGRGYISASQTATSLVVSSSLGNTSRHRSTATTIVEIPIEISDHVIRGFRPEAYLSLAKVDDRRGIRGTLRAMRTRPDVEPERPRPDRKSVTEWARLPRRSPRGI